jgi:uncharacterized protein
MKGENRIFRMIARAQAEKSNTILAASIILTIFMLYGAANIQLETDFSKMMPQDNPSIVLQKRVQDTFSGQDSIFLLIELDPSVSTPNAVRDIRDPRVMEMLIELGQQIGKQPSVDGVSSAGMIFQKTGVPGDVEGVRTILSMYSGSEGLFNRDYTATTAVINSNIGTGKEKIDSLISAIRDDIGQTPKPAGIKITLTGGPPIRALIADILITDAVKTILLSSAIILVILIIIQGGILKGYLVFNPLIFALTWTMGTMGWLNIPLSLVTAGLGAMILGLGVEYSIFLVSKYEDERRKGKKQEDSIYTALNEVGAAILGSSSTTIIGFLALLLSMMPLMHDLGKTLALGIFYCVISSLILNPAFIVFEENVFRGFIEKITCNGVEGKK